MSFLCFCISKLHMLHTCTHHRFLAHSPQYKKIFSSFSEHNHVVSKALCHYTQTTCSSVTALTMAMFVWGCEYACSRHVDGVFWRFLDVFWGLKTAVKVPLYYFYWTCKIACTGWVSSNLLSAQRRERHLCSCRTSGFWMKRLNSQKFSMFALMLPLRGDSWVLAQQWQWTYMLLLLNFPQTHTHLHTQLYTLHWLCEGITLNSEKKIHISCSIVVERVPLRNLWFQMGFAMHKMH